MVSQYMVSQYNWIYQEIITRLEYYHNNRHLLFKFWLLGMSLRQLEHYSRISKSSLSIVFRENFGVDYSHKMRYNIYSSTLKECGVFKNNTSRKDRDRIMAWCRDTDLDTMLGFIKDDDTRYYSRGQINAFRDISTKELKLDEN